MWHHIWSFLFMEEGVFSHIISQEEEKKKPR